MDYTIKELPEEERPREKLEKHGAKVLTEPELLSLILRTGVQGKNVKELSSEVLARYPLSELGRRELDELKEFDGVSRVKAGQLKAVGELARRMQREERESIESFSDVRAQVEDMKYLEREKLRAFYLSSGNEILVEKEFDGGVDSVSVDITELLRHGVRSKAAAVVIAHNHPSGKSEPTRQDIEFTEEFVEACEKVRLKLLDHVIVGQKTSSMRGSEAVDSGSRSLF